MPEGAPAKRSLAQASRWCLEESASDQLVPLGDAQCVRRQWGVCARVCEVWIVAGLLLLMGSVLCVWRCAGVRRARAVYVCVLRSRARLCVLRARRRCVLCAVLCCAPCLCSWEAQAWLAGLRGGLRRAAGGRAPA